MEGFIDNEILAGFREEVGGYLPAMRDGMDLLTQDPSMTNVIAELHRCAHSIKGAAATVGIPELSAVAAEMEVAYEMLALGIRPWSPEIADELAAGIDQIELMLAQLAEAAKEQTAQDEAAALEAPAAATPISDDVVSAEMLEVYQEEASEHVSLIELNLRELRRYPNQPGRVQEIRRSIHTLKGAAGVIGLMSASRLAARCENLLDRIYGQSVRLNPEILDLLVATAETLDVAAAGPQKAPDAAGAAAELTARYEEILAALDADEARVSGQRGGDAEVVQPRSSDQVSNDQAISEEMFEVYQEESLEHLDQVDEHLRQLRINSHQPERFLEVRRSIHTLKGAAGVIGMMTASRLARSGQDLLDRIYERQEPLTVEVLDLLADTSEILRESAVSQRRSLEFPIRVAELIAQYDGLLNPRPSKQTPSTSAPSADLLDSSFIVESGILEGALDLSSVADEPVVSEDHPVSAEMLEVYQEEAQEHLAQIGDHLRELQRDSRRWDRVQEIRRSVHTLKGAAGVIGLMTASRLAHRSEDLLDRIYERREPVTPEVIDLLFATADALEDAAAGPGRAVDFPRVAAELIARYDQALAGRAAYQAKQVSLPPEPTAEAAPPTPAATEADGTVQETFEIAPVEAPVGLEPAVETAPPAWSDLEEPVAAASSTDAPAPEIEWPPTPSEPEPEYTDAVVFGEAGPEKAAAEPEPETATPEFEFAASAEVSVEPPSQAYPDFVVSDEMLEVYQEEAEEHLAQIGEHLRELQRDPSQWDRLEEVRRSVHTLKGAAGVVGLNTASKLAHRSEDLLDRVYEQRERITPEMLELLFATADALEDAAGGSAKAPHFPAAAAALIERYEAMLAAPAPAPAPVQAHAEPPADAAPVDKVVSAEMLEVYQEEAADHLAQVGEHLRELQRDPNQWDRVQEVRRSIHTLKGAAGVVGLTTASQLAHRSEDLLDRIYERREPLTDDILEVLFGTADALEDAAAGPDKAVNFPAVASLLISRYDELMAAPAAQPSAPAAQPPAPAAQPHAPAAEPVPEAVPPAVETAPAPQPVDQVVSEEMLEVYQEEAEEHLKQVDEHLRELQRDPEQWDRVQEVRRSVHTLKGAAGVVGLNTASRLAHRSEDLLDRIYEKRERITPEVLEVLFATADALEDAAAGPQAAPEFPAKAAQLIERYEQLLASPVAPPAAPEPAAPEPVAAEPVAAEPVAAEPEPERPLESAAPAPEPVAPPAAAEIPAPPITPVPAVHAEPRIESAPPAAAPAPPPAAAPAPPPPAASAPSRAEPPPSRPEPIPAPPVSAAQPAAVPAASAGDERTQFVRVPLDRLEELVRLMGELMVNRSTLEQQYSRYQHEVREINLTLQRLKRVTGRLETDYAFGSFLDAGGAAERSAQAKKVDGAGAHSAHGFDELEFDRYTDFHLTTRDLAETSTDLSSSGTQLNRVAAEWHSALLRVTKLSSEVQERLMQLRMSPLSSIEHRLHRAVRVAATSRKKSVDFNLDAGDVELDRSILDEIAGPLEHLLRNAVDHGVESPADRIGFDKPARGVITMQARLEGAQAVIEVGDDGRGIDPERLRHKAVEKKMYTEEEAWRLDEAELHALMFQPGFSTATEVTEISGRGVGLDAVRAAALRLNGSISIESKKGLGTKFIIRLPTSLAVSKVLLLEANAQRFAMPANTVRQAMRVDLDRIVKAGERETVNIDGETLPVVRLAGALKLESAPQPADERVGVLAVQAGERRYALVVDRLDEARDVVVKGLGGLIERAPGIGGATLMGDGSVMLILNPAELFEIARRAERHTPEPHVIEDLRPRVRRVMIVDDSLSVRRVLQTVLVGAGWEPIVAKDGAEALETLEAMDIPPDVMLFDVEMPRMDGFELTREVRSRERYDDIPVVMLTSRAGEKHRQKAFELGANDYLVKPFQPENLLGTLSGARAHTRPEA